MKNFRARHDWVPPYPRIKKFKLLKIAVVISTGIYIGDIIGKSFQDTILSIRDELWYPYDEWLKTKCPTRLLMKVNLLHFIWLQFLNIHILVPHKTREYVFSDDCSVTMSANKDGAGSVCDLGTVDVTYRTAVQKANEHQQLYVC
jgi:hypothetical protein